MARTPEEKFILKIYVLTQDDHDRTVDIFEVGKDLGMREKKVMAMVTLLCQSNFLKKIDRMSVVLTQNGKALAKRLLND